MFEGCTVLELGAGCTGIPGLAAAKCGAKLVIFTDHPESEEAFKILKQNCVVNNLDENCFLIKDLDWNGSDLNQVMDDVLVLHYILAADVFYDITVFEASVIYKIWHCKADTSVFLLFSSIYFFSSNWSIEDLLLLNKLCCRRVRVVHTDLHTIHIGIIFSKTGKLILWKRREYLLESKGTDSSGATQSRLLFIDEAGKRYGEWSRTGLNCCLDGFDVVADRIAKWIQMAKKEVGIVGPLAAVGMGLSGAEDEKSNQRLINFLKDQHGDIAVEFSLSSDAVVAAAASFQNGAAVIVAGTGSACRLLKADSSVHGVGGWGHQIGDGGSAFWIARRLIQCIFDEEDGLHPSPHPISKTKRLFLEFFDLSDKAGILDILYTNFDKSRIASFAAHVAKEANDDPLVRLVFRDAGEQLGLHVRAVSRNFDEVGLDPCLSSSEMLHNARLLLIGSVWRSWELLKDGKIAIRLIRRLDLFYLYSKETFQVKAISV
ncbi:unnamed protein product [Wuchereria bancrofti]|uniref:N-acetyl-D-glucosamine kinase n=1 Tax=Wuchereria bancrofti TaxID=6293 RepID=A0A3P7DN93_WUCBA|nr:unnamed protein product [Wuchereria bancrofti]